jgi:Uma2 family endonuclease
MPVSFKTYEQLALEDSDEVWELVCGRLRKKPIMTAEHNQPARLLVFLLMSRIDRSRYTAGERAAVRISDGSYFVPDVTVIPLAAVRRHALERPRGLEIYVEPLPLVVEIWSPSTGEYDVETKLPEYQMRCDEETWRIHPYERTITAWRRQPDGSYAETACRSGTVPVLSLPGVVIEFAELFAALP